MKKTTFSIVIITKDNKDELLETICSIPISSKFFVELVVIDSSKEKYKPSLDGYKLLYKYTSPKGIYNAQNLGISISSGDFIIVMNSGDGFSKNSIKLLEKISVDSEYDAFVFSQNYRKKNGEIIFTYNASSSSVWPHQSVVIRKKIHDNFGVYPTSYKYTAEQIYFSEIRSKIKVYYSKDILSYFTHGGVSTGSLLFSLSKENFILWRKLKRGVVFSFFKSFIFPIFKFFLVEKFQLYELGNKLRKLFDSNIRL